MTLTDRIAAWLTTEDDYTTGLSLLAESGYSGFLLGLLQRGENFYNRKKLADLLRAAQPTEQSAVPQQSPAITAVEKSKESSGATTVDGVSELKQQSYQLLDERAELKARIRATIDDDSDEAVEKRRPWALRIKAIGRALDEIYSRLDFQKTNGYLPLQTDPAVAIDERAALLNARSYVSRYKRKLQNDCLTSEQRQNAQRLLEQYTLEKNRLEQKLTTNDSHTSRQQTPDCPDHPAPLPGA